jgi:hypothetical protein
MNNDAQAVFYEQATSTQERLFWRFGADCSILALAFETCDRRISMLPKQDIRSSKSKNLAVILRFANWNSICDLAEMR